MAYVKAIQFIKLSLFSICFFLLWLCIFKDFRRFMDNQDSSSISFRKFNFSPKDKYPELTICIVDAYYARPIFDEKRLKIYNLSTLKYIDTIKGETNATTEEINKLPEFSNVTIPLEYFILGKVDPKFIKFESIATNKNHSYSNKDFYLSHQDPNQLCYSITSEFNQNQYKISEHIILGFTRLSNGIMDLTHRINGILRVYLHGKGQTVRNLGKEVFRAQINMIRKRVINIHLSSFTVLRRRLDAKITCNPNIQEDDAMFRNYVIEKIKCIPPYWKIFNQTSTDLKSCDTSKKLKEAFSYNEDRKHYAVFDQFNPPCSELTTTSTVETMNNTRGTFIRFFYREDRYLEITNLPDFEFNSLWSSIGGFVGIFLGISVFQISEKVLDIINKIVISK